MGNGSPFAFFRKAHFHETTNSETPQRLAPPGSVGMRAALTTAATGLVISATGFGAFYAWTVSASHGPVLAGLAVTMALALEVAKPYSLEAAFACFRRWALVRGLAMVALALVAIAYSLTAELSLMAMTRGDATAGRQAAVDARQIAQERRQRAIEELKALPPARPAAELRGLLGAYDCARVRTARFRELCSELGRSERRADLEKTLADVEQSDTPRQAVGTADAGAASLSALLAVFGVTVAPGMLAHWLTLVGVLALECGSALSVVLVRAMAPNSVTGPRCANVGKAQPSDTVSPKEPFGPFGTGQNVTVTRHKGRKPIGDKALSGAERTRRWRSKRNSVTLN